MTFVNTLRGNNHKAGSSRRFVIIQKMTVRDPIVKKGKGLSSDVAKDIVDQLKKSRLTRQGSIKWLKNNMR